MLNRLLSNIAIMEPKGGLQEKLALADKERRSLIIKLGFDPTAPDLHLGHAVVLRKLREFQDAGHRIVVIIGDFTASIGDPTGRNIMRPPLSREEIDANSATYIKQLGLIVDTQRIEIRRNSDWYSKLDFREVINLTSKVTLAQMMQREDFKNRFDAGRPIHLHEVLYPILQGYDSVMVNADIELGGVDQLFNNLMGRTLQRALGSPGQAVITTPLLIGLDGVEKMSKSKNNYIGLTDSPEDMYGKVMSIPDRLIPDYLEFATTFDGTKKALLREALVSGTNPMTVKKEIAANIVARYNSEKAAAQAMAHFERVTQQRDLKDSDYIPLALSTLYSAFPTAPSLVDLCDLATSGMSRSHIRRLIRSGGVLVDGRKILDERASVDIAPGRTLSVGKRTRFIVTPDEA